MNLIYSLFISFILANNTNLPVEATEDPEMLRSLEGFVKYNKTQIDTIDAPVAKGISLIPSPFANAPKLIQPLSSQDAKNFLDYAAASYCPQNKLKEWKCYNCKGYGPNTTDIVYFNNKLYKSAAFLGVNHDHKLIVISYRGTDNWKNWLTDAMIKLVPFRTANGAKVFVHSGFNLAVDSLLPSIKTALLNAKEKNPSYSFVFTGHSLGGALAVLSAVKLADKSIVKWNETQLITFAQPRVGNHGFADYLESKPVKYARVTTKGDIVPKIPRISLIYKYYHAHDSIQTSFGGSDISCSNSKDPKDPRCNFYLSEWTFKAHSIFWNEPMSSDCK